MTVQLLLYSSGRMYTAQQKYESTADQTQKPDNEVFPSLVKRNCEKVEDFTGDGTII